MAHDLDPKQQLFMRVLLNHYHPTGVEALLRCLPAENAQAILSQNPSLSEPAAALMRPEEYLQEMHYSWLIEPLKKLPNSLLPLYLGALENEQRGPLAKLLAVQPSAPLSAVLKKYLILKLYLTLDSSTMLPKAFISSSPLSKLLTLSKKNLVELIDYLGIYDLAEETRNIVDTKNLKTIYGCLSARKQQFLRSCLHQKEKLITPKLHLEKWDGNCQELTKLLHMRGLYRLGKALSGQKSDLIFSITRTLDTGRGKILSQHIGPQEVPGVTQVLGLQVQSTIDFLQQGAP